MTPEFSHLFQGEEHQAFTLQGGDNAMLLVHGFPGSPAEMHPLATTLHAQGWTLRGVLLPGFGAQIDTLAQRRVDDWLHAVENDLITLRRTYQKVVLVGYSLGGALATTIAARHQVDALVLFAPFWQIKHILWHSIPMLRYAFPEFKPFRLFKPDFDDPQTREGILAYLPGADLNDPSVRQGILNFGIPMQVINQIRLAGKAAHANAPKITAPVLVVQGTQDELVKPALTQQFIQRFSGSVRYTEVAEGHGLLNTESAAWPMLQSTLIDFLQTHHLGETTWQTTSASK